MKIAIASGKGGTGKTTLSVNLALALSDAQLFDCDVEEPNCSLFLDCEPKLLEDVNCLVPIIDSEKCSLCGQCSEFCRYNALAALPSKVMVFPSLCHGCGGCTLICPEGAVREEPRRIGIIEKAVVSELEFYRGLLDIGEVMAPSIIKALQAHIEEGKTAIIDSPPGTACPVIATVENMDYCILVTESTPFGFHDLKLAIDVVRQMKIPFGVVINRHGLGDARVEKYCLAEGIPLLLMIPNDRRIAKLYSEGIPFVKEMPEWKERFREMFETIKNQVDQGGSA
ncbi:MAG: ATP-binding protein [Methanosarcinaceae archaeon]|nr:ATP-binding protein [Methanosarcinaceae archaeon]